MYCYYNPQTTKLALSNVPLKSGTPPALGLNKGQWLTETDAVAALQGGALVKYCYIHGLELTLKLEGSWSHWSSGSETITFDQSELAVLVLDQVTLDGLNPEAFTGLNRVDLTAARLLNFEALDMVNLVSHDAGHSTLRPSITELQHLAVAEELDLGQYPRLNKLITSRPGLITNWWKSPVRNLVIRRKGPVAELESIPRRLLSIDARHITGPLLVQLWNYYPGKMRNQ